MKRKDIIAMTVGLIAFVAGAATPVMAQDQKNDLEEFRTDLGVFWPQMVTILREFKGAATALALPPENFASLVPIASIDPLQVEAELAALSDDSLRGLKAQYDLLPGWQDIPVQLQKAMTPALHTTLAAFSVPDMNFPTPAGSSFAETVCGIFAGNLQHTQDAALAAVIVSNVAEAAWIVADSICLASPCSVVGIFDLPFSITAKVTTCGISGALLGAFFTAQGIADAATNCQIFTFYDGVATRVDEKLSTVATDDSAGQRSGGGFTAENIHLKLEDRLDAVMTTRSTQDSVDGQRSGRPPSAAKSVRSVVDHTDQVRLPALEKTLDETLELAKKQGELMRDFRDLLIRMQIESDLIDSGKSFREALFQLPKTLPGHLRAFCQRDIAKSCLAPGPDHVLGTDDDVTDAALCPDDSQPAELCDSTLGVCSRTRAMPCTTDPDCPGGETCDLTSHPCDHSRDRECSFDEDCPTGRPKQMCFMADPQRGFIELVREIVVEAINMTTTAGEQVYMANDQLARADALIAAGDLKNAYTRFRKAYKEAVRIGRTGH